MTKSRRRVLAALLALLLLIAGALTVLALRPDWSYRLARRLTAPTPTLPLTEFVPAELVDYTPEAVGDALMLINTAHPLPEDYVPELVSGFNEAGRASQPRMADAYASLAEAVLAEANDLLLVRDGYRSTTDQADRYAADPVHATLPGTSEHEAGLALDLCTLGYGGMSFLKTAAGRYVGDHAHEHGLIVRYLDGRDDETGIPYEPWHVRFVGAPHAALMHEGNLTLEGYLAALVPGVYYRAGDIFVTRQPLAAAYRIPAGATDITCEVDNMGHVVISGRWG